MKERVRDVPRHQDSLNTKIDPSQGEMGQRNAPSFLTLVHVQFEGEMIHPIFNPKVSLVILALMLVGDSRVEVEKRGEERIRTVRRRRDDGRWRDEAGHFRKWDRVSRAIVE